MSKWTFLATNADMPKTKEEQREFEKRMFHWGLAIKRMKRNKPAMSESGQILWGTSKERR